METTEILRRGYGAGVGGGRQRDGGSAYCVCPECGYKVEHIRGKPCNEIMCPNCNVPLVGK